ncbi:MAG: D-glycerate dehydrogenase [Candidatus Bathyarchaeia archaeon]
MVQYKVYVTSNEVPEKALQILRSIAEVRINPKDGPPSRETLLKEVADVDGLFCLLTERVDAELMNVAKKLRVVANMAVGYDNINVQEATRRGIVVTNTPGVLTETVADLTMGLILAIARRIVEADRYVRSGKWVISWTPMMMVGSDVYGKTLGIYGLGRIGSAVARRAKGFNMKVIYYDVIRNTELEKILGIEYMPLEDVLKECDYFSIHVPLLPETWHSIGEKQLALMKSSAFLVNTSRGPVVDEKALIKALQEKRIAGAALDVHEKEPIDLANPLLKMDNVILLPHIGSASIETRTAMAVMAAESIASVLKGEVPPNILNRDALKARM